MDLGMKETIVHLGIKRPAAALAIASAALLVLGPSPARAQDRLLALTTDFQTGSAATLALSAPWGVNCDLAPVCADAVVRWHGGLLYVVERYGCDAVMVLDPSTWTVLREFSVGAQSNPQDIAVISPTRAYVSCYETNDLLEVDPSTGAILGTISLAAFADQDGLCEMHRMLVYGNRLFVEVQRMFRQDWPDPWVPAPPSQLVVINLNTRQIVDADPGQPGTQGIELEGLNPVAALQIDAASGDILVPEAGAYGVTDGGGIERVDPVGMRSRGLVITEAELGGDIIDFAPWTPERAYAIVSLPGFETALVAFNPATGQRIGVVWNPGDFVLADLLSYPTGHLFVADRDYFNPGVRVFDATDGSPVAGPLFTCLPPNELVILPGGTSGAPAADAGAATLGSPYPNPSTGPVRLAWTRGASAGPARLEVVDLHGRRVRALDFPTGAAPGEISWDGLDAAGRPVPNGAYFLRVVQDGRAGGSRPVRILR